MQKILFLIFSVLIIQSSFCQEYYSTYDWLESPDYSQFVTDEETLMSVKENITTEFYFDTDDNLVEFFLEHKVLYLNSDEAIESYNKVYLPYSNDSELIINKARVIKPNGDISVLDDSKILTATDEETQRSYKYYAFEGLETGSFIEYYYVVKKAPSYRGKRIDVQASYPKKDYLFQLFSPKHLVFKFKSFNNLQAIERDSSIQEKNAYKLQLKEVEKIEEEEFSAFQAEKQFVIYALDRNTASNTRDITSYGPVAQNIFNFYNTELDKKSEKLLNEYISDSGVLDVKNSDSIVRRLESFIKTNIFITEGSDPSLSAVDDIISNKVANERGSIKLFSAALRSIKIPFEIVFTTSRDYMRFDKTFEANNFLTHVLFYIPENNKYFSPSELDSRYGYPPAYLTDNYGLFIKKVTVGDFESALGEVKFIEPIPADQTIDEMHLDISFKTDDLIITNVKLSRSMSGYYGMYIHPFIDQINSEDKTEIIKGFGKNLHEDVEFVSTEIENDKSNIFGVKPLIFKLEFNSDAFVEKAGSKYLFKVGELIGTQVEMYQEKERKLPIVGEFKRSYLRTLTINIPDGYVISNLEDININNSFVKDGNELLSFKSSYNMEGNILSITADEFYRTNHLDLINADEYITVINSAADFNKITLVITKE